jgi:hypothetical protein
VTWRTPGAQLMVGVVLALIAGSCGRPPDATSASGTLQVATIGQAAVTFASEPDPPKAGDNSFVVTVTQADGTPMTDASVTAVFSMPAMPSMNMPAMRSDAALAHEGGGRYRGTGQLSMGGTWNVTVSVSRAGQDLGSARFSVIAK